MVHCVFSSPRCLFFFFHLYYHLINRCTLFYPARVYLTIIYLFSDLLATFMTQAIIIIFQVTCAGMHMAMDQVVSPTNSPKLWNLTPLGLAPSPVVSPKHHGKLILILKIPILS